MRSLPFLLILAILFASLCATAQSESLARKSQRASEAMRAEHYDAAAALYRELVGALPANAGLRLNLGLALHSSGHFRAAIAQFEAAVKRDGKLTPAWLMLGMAHLKLGEPAAAVDPLRRVLAAEPNHPAARIELADALLALDRGLEASEHFARATQSDPQNAKAWQGLGLSYVSLSRRYFKELEKMEPGSPWWAALMARSLAEQQKFGSAFYYYRQVTSSRTDIPGVHSAVADIYTATDHPDWAGVEQQREAAAPAPNCAARKTACDFVAGRYTEVVTAPADTPESLYWHARASQQLALGAFARLAEMPPSAEIHELVARAYQLQQQFKNAATEWRAALKMLPPGGAEERRLQKELARALWLDQQYAEARPVLEELRKAEPQSAELNLELGDSLLELREYEQAVIFLREAVRLSPKLLPARASLGRALLRSERPAEAVPHLEEAVRLGADSTVLYQLSQAYQKNGQREVAEQTLRKFQEISTAKQNRLQKAAEDTIITPPSDLQ